MCGIVNDGLTKIVGMFGILVNRKNGKRIMFHNHEIIQITCEIRQYRSVCVQTSSESVVK